MVIKSRSEFLKTFNIGDLVKIEFAHGKINNRYTDWVTMHYEFKDMSDEYIYLRNILYINDMFVLTYAEFLNESIKITVI